MFFFFNDTATTEIYTLSLHDALPILLQNLDYLLTLFLQRYLLRKDLLTLSTTTIGTPPIMYHQDSILLLTQKRALRDLSGLRGLFMQFFDDINIHIMQCFTRRDQPFLKGVTENEVK